MLILFLNELSTAQIELNPSEARERVLQLIKVLQSIRKQQSQVGLNSQHPLKNTLVDQRYSLAELLSGDEYREEWRFLKGFVNRSPFSANMGAALSLSVGELEYHYQGQTSIALASIALGWADQLGTGVISFLDNSLWDEALLPTLKRELDDSANIQETLVDIRNFSQPTHVETHTVWLQAVSLSWLVEDGAFWQQREVLFPFLRFLERIESDMDTLRVSGACYHLVLQRLHELNQDIDQWCKSGRAWPEFSSKATPESESRQHLCEFTDKGKKHNFEWHLRFTGGMAGRIHFRICTQEQKAIIAYIGRKLGT